MENPSAYRTGNRRSAQGSGRSATARQVNSSAGTWWAVALFVLLLGLGLGTAWFLQARTSPDNRGVTPSTAPSPPGVSTSSLRPDLRHLKLKAHMLELVNGARIEAGLQPVILGNNFAAQLHAEQSLADCVSAHWGTDGLKPYMRYSLAGGYQGNAENVTGIDYCIRFHDGYEPIEDSEAGLFKEVRKAVDGLMDSPEHRKTILTSHYRKLNIGWDSNQYNLVAVQHFEGDYVEFDQLPRFVDGVLKIEARTKNGLQVEDRTTMAVQIFYDQPPKELTRGQISRTYCYGPGTPVGALRYQIYSNNNWAGNSVHYSPAPCQDPYAVPPETDPPGSVSDAALFHELSQFNTPAGDPTIVPWITAQQWQTQLTSFQIEANLQQALKKHGPGVYTIVIRGKLDGEDTVVAEYSIWHEIEPPDTYEPSKWNGIGR